MKKRDWILIAVGVVILAFLWAAPKESTKHMPQDETHRHLYDLVKTDGKKTAEKFCEDCHKPDGVPFPENHPSKTRCLLCHKLDL